MPVAHYENFPVASILLPRHLRRPVESIYWFARSADDLADEGEHSSDWRLSSLDDYRQRLDSIANGGRPHGPGWQRLATDIADHGLPFELFHDLLDAFSQDVRQSRYSSFPDLEAYCRRSANPVGRLLLHLFGTTDAKSFRESDAICTSLQLLNFCQDVAIDWTKDRIYIPLDEMAAHGVSERHIAGGIVDTAWRRLFEHQLQRAVQSLRAGNRLPDALRGRCALELRAIIAGGERIGQRLAATGGDVFRQRPVLRRRDWLIVLLQAFRLLPAAPATSRPVSATTP